MRRSLAFKWIATLLLSSLIGVVLIGLFAYRATTSEFDRLRAEQAVNDFVVEMRAYYAEHGSWEGLVKPEGEEPYDWEDGDDRRSFEPRNFFALIDLEGRVVLGHGPYEPGMPVPTAELANGTPILVNGEQVGTALLALPPPGLDPREQRYVDATNRALVIGAVGAAMTALLVGMLLSRGFLRQLGELTRAMAAMRQGDLNQTVQVYSKDELGALAQAFNQMSADLHRANDLRQQMTADIAHELRTPLTVISGYVEGLTDGTFKPTPARFEAIGAEVALLRRLVEDLRTLSLAEAGELKLVRQPVAPADLLESIQRAFGSLAEKQGLTLKVEAEADLPLLPLDRERMIQVLANLTSNALRHTPSGSVTLSARRMNGTLELSVRDTGAGIPAEHLPNVFERFYRVEPSRRAEEGESGLGLSIVKAIVEAHGGTISATSVVGSGTTMTVRLSLPPQAG